VWHASIAVHNRFDGRPLPTVLIAAAQVAEAWAAAARALAGVGDAALGEWRETGHEAFHLRRRLAPTEWTGPWGMDYRGTPEGERRVEACRAWLPAGFREW
jgi:hypothetical protein